MAPSRDLQHADPSHADPAAERDTDAVEQPGPTVLGGRFLMGLMVLTAIVWVVSLVRLVQLPAQEGATTTSWDTALWVAIALASAISTFILGFWKVHRT